MSEVHLPRGYTGRSMRRARREHQELFQNKLFPVFLLFFSAFSL
jgi:hypothetical protein